jgi:hypothetical protein
MVLDNYLWGFVSVSTHIHYSILWGFLLAVAFIGITSEPVFARLTNKMNNRVLGAAGRLRTYILAWRTVSFGDVSGTSGTSSAERTGKVPCHRMWSVS